MALPNGNTFEADAVLERRSECAACAACAVPAVGTASLDLTVNSFNNLCVSNPSCGRLSPRLVAFTGQMLAAGPLRTGACVCAAVLLIAVDSACRRLPRESRILMSAITGVLLVVRQRPGPHNLARLCHGCMAVLI